MKLFNCEKKSNFINYETEEQKLILKAYTGKNLENYVQDMIWGDIQDKQKIKEKLYYDTILSIQEDLKIYNKYTKYALNDNKLIIIGDVLYNGQSLKQLYNLIQLKCKKISGIIFKDNGKIPPKIFSNLMKQFFLIPKLKQISFLSSVLDEDSLYELQYLIIKKNVQYLILYRSYFLRHEIDKLLNINNTKTSIINHQRFIIIDISQKKAYEFTPYSNFNDLKSKNEENMFEQEKLYIQQKTYPLQIQNQIIFFQGKNLCIVNKNRSEKILFRYWDFLNYRQEDQRLKFQEKQDNLIKILEEQFREDDINILNYSLVKTLIKNVFDKEARRQFEETLNKSKSFIFLKERFPLQVAELICFKKESYLQTCYSYLYGFTSVKDISIFYIYNNNNLHQDIRQNKKKSPLEIKGNEISLTIKEMFTSKQKDEASIKQVMQDLEKFVNFKTLLELQIQENKDPDKSFLFLNQIFKECTNLKKLSLSSNMLNDNKLKGVDFKQVSNTLEEFDINNNTNIDDMSFLNGLFLKATNLKKLGLQKVSLIYQKIKNIKFEDLSHTLEDLDISFNIITDIEFLNTIFKNIPKLKRIDMTVCSLNTDLIKKIQFAPGLKEIIMNDNTNINMAALIVNIGETKGMELEYFSAYEIGGKEPMMSTEYNKHNEQLKVFSKLKKLHFWNNEFSDEKYVNLILSSYKSGLIDLTMKDTGLNQFHFEKLNLENIQKLEILDLCEGHRFQNFNFLFKIFQQATFLKTLNLGSCNMTNQKLDYDIMNEIPKTLEEFYFQRNGQYGHLVYLLKLIIQRCQSLKVLRLEQCNIEDQEIDNINWVEISTKLINFNIAHNPRIQNYEFLNDIFKRATYIQKINLKGNQIGKALDQINFDLLSNTIQEFIADEDQFYNQEFQEQLFNRYERYMNFYTFQQKFSNLLYDPNINYFGVFEQQNLSQFRKQKEEEEEEPIRQNQKKTDNKEKPKNIKESDAVSNSKHVKYTQHINPLYFYSFFSKLGQLILIPQKNQEKDSNQTKNKQSKAIFQKIVENQNVYSNFYYKLLQFIDFNSIEKTENELFKQSNTDIFDFNIYFTALNELNLSNQVYSNFSFLSFFLKNGSQITKIDMSNMDLKFEKQERMDLSLNSLIEVNFSGNKCLNKNIFDFLNNILSNAPKLEKLNLSNMNMNEKHFYDFDQVKETLKELNISENKHIPTLSVLNGLFKRCQQLLVLNISKTGLNIEKLRSTQFMYISPNLKEFNCSDNDELNTVDFINKIIWYCPNIEKLNLSNCNISHIDNTNIYRIQLKSLSSTLKEIDLSKNYIIGQMHFLSYLTEQCKSLEKINMSGQIAPVSYLTHNKEFIENSLQDFNFSESIYFADYEFVPQLISKSNKFCRLTIQQMNLSQRRFEYFRFKDIGKQIKQLDISKNDNLEDISQINFLVDSPEFSEFIAKQTSLNNTLINQLDIPNVFKNLKTLDLSECHNFITFDFLNQLFLSAQKLENLNLSGMLINQTQIDFVEFQNTPKTLKELDISQNKFIENFKFLNELFIATNDSLICLNLSECDLDQTKLQDTNFSLLNKKIEQINLQKNEKLDRIDFLNNLFDNSNVLLKKLKISKASVHIISFLLKHINKIEKIDCNFLKIDFQFFSEKQFVVNFNMIKLLKYFESDEFPSTSKQGQADSQQLQEIKDTKKFIIIEFLKYMMEKKSSRKPFQTIQHFFYLLMNEVKIQSYYYQSDFFIMSPYFLFQQPQENNFQCDQQMKKEKKDLIKDSYKLSFFELNLLKNRKKTDYIFGYDKFFFQEFPDFYVQNFEGIGSDLQFIIDLKSNMENYGVKKAFLPIRLTLTQEIIKQKKLNEFQVLQLINLIPPSVINLKGMSIQFVKSWYAINFYAPLSVQTNIDVDYSLIENSSIANFLTIRSYHLYVKNFTGKTFLSKLKQRIGKRSYQFFSLISSQPNKFDFDHTVIHLENAVKQYLDSGKYNILRALFPFYIFFCIFGVYFFSFTLEITCGNGISWYSYGTYAVFGFITFIIEAFIFSTCLKYVSHLIPELKPNCLQTFPYPFINSIKLFILDINWINQWYINYLVSFVLSQLSRFDFFTNISFLFTTYQCGDMLVFNLALISLSITTFIQIVFFIWNFREDDRHLVTGKLDKLYEICNLLEFQAVADVLDIISPSNCVMIFGKMFNQRIVNYFIRILLQDIPFLIIQVLYLLRKGVFNRTIIFSLISSGLMFLVSIKNFLTITPSRLGQEDFNQINTIKKKRILPNYLKKLSDYESQIVKLNLYELLKCIRSQNYFKNKLERLNISNEQKQQQLLMAKELQDFYPNQECMIEIFGKLQCNNDINDDPLLNIEKYFKIQEKYFNYEEKNQTKKNQSNLNKKDFVSKEEETRKQNKNYKFLKKITGQEEKHQKHSTTKVTPYGEDTPHSKGSKSQLLENQNEINEQKQSFVFTDKSENEDYLINIKYEQEHKNKEEEIDLKPIENKKQMSNKQQIVEEQSNSEDEEQKDFDLNFLFQMVERQRQQTILQENKIKQEMNQQ